LRPGFHFAGGRRSRQCQATARGLHPACARQLPVTAHSALSGWCAARFGRANQSPVVIHHGKITLLTFFYTYCHDPWGCPFAYQTLTGLRSKLLAEPELARRVRFVSVSFDPTHDTPAELQRYASSLKDDRLEWRFLTARSVADLMPVLDGFGQDVSVVTDEHGQPTRTVDHMLKLFLIDRHGIVREIYSLAYLQPQVMLNDIKTLALDESAGFSAVR
jgi:cytochrome oxidase Cu insertion factor (SCO1/SenC/PrrC family)